MSAAAAWNTLGIWLEGEQQSWRQYRQRSAALPEAVDRILNSGAGLVDEETPLVSDASPPLLPAS